MKVKGHRGEPLNETDDLQKQDTLCHGRGRGTDGNKDNTSGVFVLRQDLGPMEKRHMEQDSSKYSKERSGGISVRGKGVTGIFQGLWDRKGR